jgi:hypothetical protein
MSTPYPIVKKYEYPKLEATTFATGGRVYHTPNGHKVPSVTTILSTLPKDGLIEWRERVGDEEADRITDEACRIGTTMHDRLEGYVSNYLQGRPNIPPETEEERLAYQMAENMKRYGMPDLDVVWGIEEALYCEQLYAGRTDLIGVYMGKSAIIDYKSARKWKRPEWVEGYRMQIAAYNFCHKAMFGEGMESGVILIAVRPSDNPYSKQQALQRFILNKSDLDRYEDMWLALVERYYAEHK